MYICVGRHSSACRFLCPQSILMRYQQCLYILSRHVNITASLGLATAKMPATQISLMAHYKGHGFSRGKFQRNLQSRGLARSPDFNLRRGVDVLIFIENIHTLNPAHLWENTHESSSRKVFNIQVDSNIDSSGPSNLCCTPTLLKQWPWTNQVVTMLMVAIVESVVGQEKNCSTSSIYWI